MDATKTPLVVQPGCNHTHTVVFLHGRGDTAPNFVKSLAHWRDSHNHSLAELYPSFRWVFPWAPVTPAVGFNNQPTSQWFDIWNVRDFSDKEEHQIEGLKESVHGILKLLAAEADALSGRWDRMVLMGISQGAATAIHTMLHLHEQAPRLGAFIGFSCRMPFPGRTLRETRGVLNPGAGNSEDVELLKKTPILLEHCVDDPLVLVQNGRALRECLRGFGAQVSWVEYPSGGHWLNSPHGIDDVAIFLNSVLNLK